MKKAPNSKSRGSGRSAGLEIIRKGIAEGYSAPVAKLVGFRLTDVGRGWSVMEMEVGPQHANPMGTLHGGIICDIADAAMGLAYLSTLGEGESFTTVEMKVNFLRPVWKGRITARGKVIKKGRTTGLVDCKAMDEKRRLVAYATSTCMTLAAAPGEIKREGPHARDSPARRLS